ncbi:sulfatase-like hydrolase/transferase [Coraliomargarita sp. W4R53]
MFNKTHLYFFTFTYVFLVGLLLRFLDLSAIHTVPAVVYGIVRCFVYAAVYLLFPFLLTKSALWLYQLKKEPSDCGKWFVYSLIYALAALPVLAVYADFEIYKLYAYHFDGFVWNILTTSGGVDALGATTSTQVNAVISVFSVLLALVGGFYVSLRLATAFDKCYISRRGLLYFWITFIFCGLSVEVVHAYAKYVALPDLQQAGSYIPFSFKTSMSSAFKKAGITKVTHSKYMPEGEVNYPLAEIKLGSTPEPLPNIIILAAESFRWDLLDPEVTPNLWEFAKRSINLTNHYSGGNRTRMGMFSMFYGLYSPYWFLFEENAVPPVLMTTIQQLGYQLELNTSQSFDYPELRRTVFSGISETYLHELKQGPSWQRDRDNISAIQKQISERDPSRPFFNFMFFESTHAPYNFPESAVLEPDYLENVDYLDIAAGMSIYKLHNRYINAAHHVDAEIGKLLSYLDEEGLMANTIILFTGDHGEEFMEKGRWGHGHNDKFTTYQTRVPFVLHIPGETPREITTLTNHLQIPATLMEILGVENDYEDFAMAPDLFAATPDYFLLGNYNYMTLQDTNYKITFPFTGQDFFHYSIYHADTDNPVTREESLEILQSYQDELDDLNSKLNLFCN